MGYKDRLTSAVEGIGAEADSVLADRDRHIADLEDQKVVASQRIRDLEQKLLDLQTEFDEYKRTHPDTTPEPEPEPEPTPVTKRFPGDKGKGHVQYGWDVEGMLTKYMGAEITKMSAIAPARKRQPLWAHKYAGMGEQQFKANQDGQWAASKGINVFINWSAWSPNDATNYLRGDRDAWIKEQGTLIKGLGQQFGIVVGWCHANEPDAPDKEWDNTKAGRKALRDCHLRTARIFRDMGVTNQFMVSPPTIAQIYHYSDRYYREGKHWWGEYYPLLKEGVDPLTWPDIWTPDKDDFTDEFFCMLGINQYCWHGMNGYGNYDPAHGVWEWDQAEAERHTVMSDAASKHGALANKVAKNLNVPILISEWGMPIKELQSGTDLAGTKKWWLKQHAEFAGSQVAIAIMWKQVLDGSDSAVKTSALAIHGRHAQMSTQGTKGWPDGNNCRAVAFAGMQDAALNALAG